MKKLIIAAVLAAVSTSAAAEGFNLVCGNAAVHVQYSNGALLSIAANDTMYNAGTNVSRSVRDGQMVTFLQAMYTDRETIATVMLKESGDVSILIADDKKTIFSSLCRDAN